MSSAIPQLSEDVYEKILQIIIPNKQAELSLSLSKLMEEHAGLNLPKFKCDKNRVKWPKLLQSNSQRLVYHDFVPLLKDSLLCVLEVHDAKRLARYHYDTLKHVGQVAIYNLNGVEAAPVIVKPKQIESIENCPCSKCQVNFYGSFDNSSDDDDSYYDEVDYWFEERESSEVKDIEQDNANWSDETDEVVEIDDNEDQARDDEYGYWE